MRFDCSWRRSSELTERPRLLIEEWLPIKELGVESQRERANPLDLPPLAGLHVWWARRPLVASAGAILASLLPPWTEQLAADLDDAAELRSSSEYSAWFLRLCGILGDPVAARALSDAAKAAGAPLSKNPFTYKQAFKNRPSSQDISLLHRVLERTWGRLPRVLDPTAGGGSIPFESIRYGLPSTANDLNPVAASLLRAGVGIPGKFGPLLLAELQHWGRVLVGRLVEVLNPYFPTQPGEQVTNYIFARTVPCPRTGKPTPLSPNWWLARHGGGIATQPVTEEDGHQLDAVRFDVMRGAEIRFNPDHGTTAGGDAVSVWDRLAIDSEYIKAEAQAGRMGEQLMAVVVRRDGQRDFRSPNAEDLDALHVADLEVRAKIDQWLEEDVVPSEAFPPGNDMRPPAYGMTHWRMMFSPRQLLVHASFVMEFRKVATEVRASLPDDQAQAVLAELALMIGKGVDWNSRLCTWHQNRGVVGHTFQRHDFAFVASYAEFQGSTDLYPWVLDRGLLRAFKGLSESLRPSDAGVSEEARIAPAALTVLNQNAANLADVETGSQTLVCIDPPYYDNVMYAELSDFFYVWEKRTLGVVWPELFAEELTDKKNEAVANAALFADLGRRRRELAAADYEAKMQAIFAECNRVLTDDGVMTVMFTHKSADAWDALGMALMEAGFTIEASWPVNTESAQSLHQARKNAAASTILLVCRKRDSAETGDYFEDLEPLVRAEARRSLTDFAAQGIGGVDLLLATYGPALSVISSRWPVYSSEADPISGRSRLLRPEEALDAARAEVARLQRNRLIGREQSLDPLTDFAMVAWDTFKAVEFPFDEARRLALAIGGLDIEELRRAKVLEKKSGTVLLLSPAKRARRDVDFEAGLPGVYPEATGFTVALDGVHTAIYIADVDGLAAAKAFLDRAGLTSDARFLATMQGLVNAIPRTRVKGEWVVPEAETLDRLSAAYFPDIELPQEPEMPSFEQASLLGEE